MACSRDGVCTRMECLFRNGGYLELNRKRMCRERDDVQCTVHKLSCYGTAIDRDDLSRIGTTYTEGVIGRRSKCNRPFSIFHNFFVYLNLAFKGQSNEIFDLQFFYHLNQPGPLTDGLTYFRF